MCFYIGNLKLLELLEAPFDNISVVSSVLLVLKRIYVTAKAPKSRLIIISRSRCD